MELLARLPAFLGAVLVISAVPGPAVALLVRRCTLGGWRAGVPVLVGLELGLYLWVLAAGAGLAALVATSRVAFLVLRVVGAVVLVALGVQALRSARRQRAAGLDPAELADVPLGAARLLPRGRSGGFLVGLVTNVANPKAAVFCFAFYPAFLPHGYPVLPVAAGLGLLQVSVEFALYLALCLAVGRAREWFSRAVVRRRLDALCGVVLVALGLRVATESA